MRDDITLEAGANELNVAMAPIAVELETLEVRIDPAGAGYVTTNPEALEGHPGERWYDDDTGKFEHGITVHVTAHPYSGYTFKSWSGEMKDTTAITAPVYSMTEKRTITAHFEAEVVYAGTITKKELKYQLSLFNWTDLLTIPASGIPQGTKIRIHITGRNDTDTAQRMGIGWTVTDPDGLIVAEYGTWEAWPYTGAGDEHEFVTPVGEEFLVSKAGTYRVAIELRMNEPDPVIVDPYIGDLCTVVPIVSFGVRPWGITPDCSHPEKWACYYWDPGIGDYVGDGKWHKIAGDTRDFEDVQPGGYLSAFYLDYDGTVSKEYYSDIFYPIDGATYQFELASGRVYEI
ncbi:hypothetical protein ES708_02272 [subsurface metagenome]